MSTVPRSSLPCNGSILLLNGASSSGKSSLAKSLQAVLPGAWLHLQLDAFRRMEPTGYFGSARSEFHSIQVAALCRAMNAAVIEFTSHGQNVVIDHVVSRAVWPYLLDDFSAQRVFLVGVHCAAEELSRREGVRGNRKPGLATSQAGHIHKGCDYDFSVDTTQSPPATCASALLDWWQQAPEPQAFHRMRARYAMV